MALLYGLVDIVNAISNAVVAELAAGGYPPLTDGKILLGRQHQYVEDSPNRIMFTPTTVTWAPRSPSSASNISSNHRYSPEGKVQIAYRALLSERCRFEIRCWGSAGLPGGDTGNPDDDFLVTQHLYQSVIRQTHLMAVGSYNVIKAGGGEWTHDNLQNTQLNVNGNEFVYVMVIEYPLLDKMLPFAPNNVTGNYTTIFVTPDGGSGPGCV